MVGTNETVAQVLAITGNDEPSEEDFKAMGVPELGRVEIPVRDRYALADIADHLAELATRLRGIQRDTRFSNLHACSMAFTEVKMTNYRVKQARLKSRIPTKSGG